MVASRMPAPAGWEYTPKEVEKVLSTLDTPLLSGAPRAFLAVGDNPVDTVFMDAEEIVFNQLLEAWNQKRVGSCVAFASGRGAQDRFLIQIAQKKKPEILSAQVAPEPIYWGSRVEVGGGRLGRGDGSVGAWAAKWLTDWGVLLRLIYRTSGGTCDLTEYSEERCREFGYKGCPDFLEPEAKLHPVEDISLVDTEQALIAALCNWCPVVPCSNYGFDSPRDKTTGVCRRAGSWGHAMVFRGIVILKGGRVCVILQNSWGDNLGGTLRVTLASGRVITLPTGCCLIDLADAVGMCRQGDTFAYNAAKGWKKPKISFRKTFKAA